MKTITACLSLLLACAGCSANRPPREAASAPPPADTTRAAMPSPPPPATVAVPPPPPPPTASSPGPGQVRSKHMKAAAMPTANAGKLVRVFFATDRQLLPQPVATAAFGPDRSAGGRLSYGTCLVNIPPGHTVGVLESPSLLRLEFHNDPTKHLFVTRMRLANATDFFLQAAGEIDSTGRRSAFIFVHGYNVSFDEAARRTAQIACDVNFDGVPLFYSWPSRASLDGYAADEGSIEWAGPHLKAFLRDFLQKTDAQNVYLIAHSMGNRGLTRAVAELVRENPDFGLRLRELILAAPDIDQDIFRDVIGPVLTARFPPVTLYASSRDKALLASQALHKYARAGEAGSHILVMPGIETVDASAVDLDLLGHGYVAEARPVIADLSLLLLHDTRAAQRQELLLVPKVGCWDFRP